MVQQLIVVRTYCSNQYCYKWVQLCTRCFATQDNSFLQKQQYTHSGTGWSSLRLCQKELSHKTANLVLKELNFKINGRFRPWLCLFKQCVHWLYWRSNKFSTRVMVNDHLFGMCKRSFWGIAQVIGPKLVMGSQFYHFTHRITVPAPFLNRHHRGSICWPPQ